VQGLDAKPCKKAYHQNLLVALTALAVDMSCFILQPKTRVEPAEKNDWQEPCKFDCWLGLKIFIFCCCLVPHQFSQDIGEWRENQFLIPDWTYFHCPGATLTKTSQNATKPRNGRIVAPGVRYV